VVDASAVEHVHAVSDPVIPMDYSRQSVKALCDWLFAQKEFEGIK
jgi:hypothetical protein